MRDAKLPALRLSVLGSALVLCAGLCGCGSSPDVLSSPESQQSQPRNELPRYSRQQLRAGPNPVGLVSADFNGDGLPDLAVVNSNLDGVGGVNGGVSIFLGNGDGTFQTKIDYPVGIGPELVVAADFNSDGILDLAVSNTSEQTVSLLLGNGDGTFRSGGKIKYPSGTGGLTVGDFNGDGLADLAVTGGSFDGDLDRVTVFLNNGDGSFHSIEFLSGGSIPLSITTGDLNGDGILDLAVVNQHSHTVGVFLGAGDGTFRQSATLEAEVTPLSITVGDFKGDRHPGLAVTNDAGPPLFVFLGKGDGKFDRRLDYHIGPFPGPPLAVDINGDGHVDLLLGTLNRIAVLLGKGDGTFRAPIYLHTVEDDDDVSIIITADFNGDGIPDIAASNFRTGTVTLFLSQNPVRDQEAGKSK